MSNPSKKELLYDIKRSRGETETLRHDLEILGHVHPDETTQRILNEAESHAGQANHVLTALIDHLSDGDKAWLNVLDHHRGRFVHLHVSQVEVWHEVRGSGLTVQEAQQAAQGSNDSDQIARLSRQRIAPEYTEAILREVRA